MSPARCRRGLNCHGVACGAESLLKGTFWVSGSRMRSGILHLGRAPTRGKCPAEPGGGRGAAGPQAGALTTAETRTVLTARRGWHTYSSRHGVSRYLHVRHKQAK